MSAHTYRVALLVVDSAVATPVTFVAVVTSIIDTFLGVKEKPCVAYDGVLDFSKRTGHQCTHIGGFFLFRTINDNFYALLSTLCLLFLSIVMERYINRYKSVK